MGKLRTEQDRFLRKLQKKLVRILYEGDSYLLRSPDFTQEEIWDEFTRIKGGMSREKISYKG